MKISVIIPVYNMGQYIKECLDSVLRQSLYDIEVVVVDDGSTDDSAEIVKSFFDERIHYFFQKNSGAGIARNKGILEAKGEYIAFLDPDDYYPDDKCLEKLYCAAKEQSADICGGNICYLRNGVLSYDGARNGEEIEKAGWLDKNDILSVIDYVKFIYKRSFLYCNHFCFPNYRRNQDNPFFLKCVAKAGRIYCITDYVYCYRKGHKEIQWNEEKMVDWAKGVREELTICLENGMHTIYENRLKELKGEFSAILYSFSTRSEELNELRHELNQIIASNGDAEDYFKEGMDLEQYIDSIISKYNEFWSMCKKYPHRILFGAGDFGSRAIPFLKKNGISVDAVAVSNTKNNVSSVEGIPVKSIDTYIKVKDEYLVIVAVYPFIQMEIKDKLNQMMFSNVYFMDIEEFMILNQVSSTETY